MALGNSIQRILVAIVAIPVVLAACYFGKFYFLIFAAGIALLAFHEFSALTSSKNAFVNKIPGYISIILIFINSYFQFIDSGNLIAAIVCFVLIAELFRNKESAIYNSGVSLLGIFYTGYLTSFLVKIREFYNYSDFTYSNGGFLIIAMLMGIWFCDSFAYFLGCAFGKHKLFPRVSPKKSWEGAIAGFIFTIVALILAKSFLISVLSWKDVFLLGAIIGVVGQIGDLIESLFKRDAQIKDSSALIPGHGGILDRFDSLILSAPVVYIYLFYTLK